MKRRFDRILWWSLALAQLAIPAAYYAGLRDPDDERFAWRMFSATRLQECSVRVYDEATSAARAPAAGHPIRDLHSSWVHALERGRGAVIARYLALQCAHPVRLERRCHGVDGSALPVRSYRLDCQTGEVAAVVGSP